MDDSIAQPYAGTVPGEWANRGAWACALLLSLLFVVSGGWKLLYPLMWSAALLQFKVPGELAVPATLALGITEMFGGVLLVVPRFRRWGSAIVAALLLIFMIYMAIHYAEFKGMDCTCFPMLKRTVGPGFFVGDVALLFMALGAWVWSSPSFGIKPAALVLSAIAVFGVAAYGITIAEQKGLRAPATVKVDGKPYVIGAGRVLLYFFDPECTHCLAASRRMATYKWNDVKLVYIPTRVPQFAEQFMKDSGMMGKTVVSSDLELLRQTFKFGDPPYGVMLENGTQKEMFPEFDEKEPTARLKALGYIE